MVERTTITQVTQVGAETTPGTAVGATKRLSSLSIKIAPNPEVTPFKPKGTKYPSLSVVNREWSTIGVEGIPTYDELAYLLSSTVNKVTPSGPGADDEYTWTFDSSNTTPDTPQTFTFEEGSSVRAHRVGHALLDSFGLEFSRESVSLSGGGFAYAIQDGITLTGPRVVTDGVTVNTDATVTSATASFTSADVGKNIDGVGIPAGATIVSINSGTSVEISSPATAAGTGVSITIGSIDTVPLVPVLPGSICVFRDDTAGGLGTTKLERVLSGSINVSGRWGPLWTVNCALASFATYVELDPTVEFKLMLEADAQGMTELDDLRSGTPKFFEIEATGPIIDGTTPHVFRFQACGIPTAMGEYSDEQGVYANEWTLQAFYSDAWAKAFRFQLVNTLAGL